MIGDYEEIAARAFEEPYVGELRELVRVCADHFESAGDPRGTLISLGDAHFDATGRRAHELQRAIDEHVLAHHEPELGGVVDLLRKPRTCVLDWRAGRLYRAQLDTRYAASREAPGEMVRALLQAPAASALRRLSVRVRQDRDVGGVVAALRAHEPKPPLEELLVIWAVRPRRLDGFGAVTLAAIYPQLYCYGERDALVALLPADLPVATESLVKRIRAVEAPLDDDGRTLLGRTLTSPDPAVRDAALGHVAKLGDHAAVFIDLLALLLQPGFAVPKLPIIECLRGVGRVARRALPALVKIPGRATHYDQPTRRAAGTLIASLR